MHVSAQVRYLDYSTRPLYAKNKRRPDDEDTLLSRKVDPRSEEDRPEEEGQAAPEGGFDDDETLEYSRQVADSAAAPPRRDMVAESGRPTVRAAPSVQATALWALLGSAKADTAPPPAVPAPKAPGHADAFYDLLDQVIAQA